MEREELIKIACEINENYNKRYPAMPSIVDIEIKDFPPRNGKILLKRYTENRTLIEKKIVADEILAKCSEKKRESILVAMDRINIMISAGTGRVILDTDFADNFATITVYLKSLFLNGKEIRMLTEVLDIADEFSLVPVGIDENEIMIMLSILLSDS